MSIERESRKALRRLFLWRLVGDLIGFPRSVFLTVAQFFGSVERTVFYLELDAARRYRAITNTDLALAAGELHRYSGLARVAADERDSVFHPEVADEDDE